MSIFEGSRYDGAKVVNVKTEDGLKKFVSDIRRKKVVTGSVSKRTVREGDMLDLYSFEANGKEKDWWIVAFVNDIKNGFDIEAGEELYVPQKRDFKKIRESRE